MHNFHKYLDDFSNKITNKIISLPELNSCNVLKLVDAIKYIIKVGGKRLRPLLVVEISKILNVSQESAYRVGMAIELIHCYSLVHDDLPAMDDDEIRRGSPTCHVKFDEATAILVGDALQSLAFQVLSDVKTHSDSEIRCKLINELSKSSGVSGMVGGQMLDLITSGQNLIIRFAVKPTSSILNSRETINIEKKNTSIITKGRHDPCVGIRAVPVGEAMLAIVLADNFLINKVRKNL